MEWVRPVGRRQGHCDHHSQRRAVHGRDREHEIGPPSALLAPNRGTGTGIGQVEVTPLRRFGPHFSLHPPGGQTKRRLGAAGPPTPATPSSQPPPPPPASPPPQTTPPPPAPPR